MVPCFACSSSEGEEEEEVQMETDLVPCCAHSNSEGDGLVVVENEVASRFAGSSLEEEESQPS